MTTNANIFIRAVLGAGAIVTGSRSLVAAPAMAKPIDIREPGSLQRSTTITTPPRTSISTSVAAATGAGAVSLAPRDDTSATLSPARP